MTNYTGYTGRKAEEVVVEEPQQEREKNRKLFSWLNRIGQHLATALFQGQEPKIWQSTDRFGQTWWHAYDPVKDRFVSRDSEAEMRIWLEERYYR